MRHAGLLVHDRISTRRFPACRRLHRRGAGNRRGRGPRADRPERRRQIHPDQDPDRRLSQGWRRHPLRRQTRRRSAVRAKRSESGIATIYQELNLVPLRSVTENVVMGYEPRRLGRAGRLVRGAPWRTRDDPGPLRYRHRCQGTARQLFHRHSATGRHRPRRLARGTAGDHGRADLVARRSRGRGAVRGGAAN